MYQSIQLVTPIPPQHLGAIWDILREFPANSFDDSGPRDLDAFVQDIRERYARGEFVWEVIFNGQVVGAIGYIQHDRHTGFFHGIAFTRAVHGTGVPREAVATVLNAAFSTGTTSVWAEFFEDNARVNRFLEKFGAVEHVRFQSIVPRRGRPIKHIVVEITADEFRIRQNRGLRADQADSHRTEDLRCTA